MAEQASPLAPARRPAAPEPEAGRRVGLTAPVVAGVLIIALFFGAFGGWAALAPLNSAAMAPGVVSVDTKRKTVQHLEGGIIGELLVRDGDEVKAGQVLIRLDDTQPRATLDLIKGRRRAAAAVAARLVAERDGRDEVFFPDWLAAERDNVEVAAVIDGEISIFLARRQALRGQVRLLEQRIAQFREEIKGLQGQIAAEDTQLRLIAEEAAAVKELLDKGLERKPRLLALKRQEAEIEGSRSRDWASIARAKQNIGEARLRISELEIERMNEVVQQLREVQNELFDLSERFRAAEDVFRRTAIVAIQDGVIVGLRVHTPGGVIAPGEALMDIVPSGERLVIEARVDPNDIDVVEAGLSARVQLTAFNLRSLAPIEGRVVSVSADRLTDERTGEAYYLARVELLEDPADVLDGASLYPGMQADVMIVTGERTALEYLIRPITRSFDRAFRED